MFGNLKNNYQIIPLAFIQRDSVFTLNQAESLFGDIYSAKKLNKIATPIIIVLGVLIILLGVFMICKYNKIKRMEELGATENNTGKDGLLNINRTENKSS